MTLVVYVVPFQHVEPLDTPVALICIGSAVAAGWFLDWYSQLENNTEMRHAIQALRSDRCDEEIWEFTGHVTWSGPHRYLLLFPINDAPDEAGASIETKSSSPEVGIRLTVRAKHRCKRSSTAFFEVSRITVSP
jgi:hypothetical protein